MRADSYDGTVENVLKIQKDVALAIADAIHVAISADEHDLIREARDVNPDAYELYLKARRTMVFGHVPSAREGVNLLERAIEIEPTFPEAHAFAAFAYHMLASFGPDRPEELFALSRSSVRKALRQDPNLSLVHSGMGWGALGFEWDWDEAAFRFRRALELDSSDEWVYDGLIMLHLVCGRVDKALEACDAAAQIRPNTPGSGGNRAFVYLCTGQYEEALRFHSKIIEQFPGIRIGYLRGIESAAYAGQFQLARQWADRAIELGGSDPIVESALAMVSTLEGDPVPARSLLKKLHEQAKTLYNIQYDIATLQVHLGDHDEAVRALERAYKDREMRTIWIDCSRHFDPLREHPGFQEIVRKLDFPE